MLLSTLAIFSALAFATFILGWVTGYHELAVIGAVIVFGLGAGVTAEGLEVESGEVEIEENGTVTTETQYSDVGLSTSIPFGTLLMFVGASMLLRSLDNLGGG